MEKRYTKQELSTLVAVTLDGTRIDPKTSKIDKVIPDSILYQYDPDDVLEVAADYGFMIVKCCMGNEYKANGVWREPNSLALEFKLSRHKQLSHTYCPLCEERYREQWHLNPSSV
jgi:hypothetical protein